MFGGNPLQPLPYVPSAEYGVALRVLRAQKGILQENLALESGIDRRFMSDIENGR